MSVKYKDATIFVLTANQAADAPAGKVFRALKTDTFTGSTLTVKGYGLYNFISSGASGSGYIDPATGEEFAGNVPADGYYEALPTTGVTFSVPIATVIEGKFLSVSSSSASTAILYE